MKMENIKFKRKAFGNILRLIDCKFSIKLFYYLMEFHGFAEFILCQADSGLIFIEKQFHQFNVIKSPISDDLHEPQNFFLHSQTL